MSWRIEMSLALGAIELDVEMSGGTAPVSVIGPNGSGKTTLLRTIAGAHRPDRGLVRIGDEVLLDTDAGVDFPPEARRVGYVPQGHGLFPHLRVIDNVCFGRADRGPGDAGRARGREEARALLADLGCASLGDRWPAGLSGGESQRVALARALMIHPRILLLDEPLAAMDAGARRALRAYLGSYLSRQAIPAIVVTHDARDVRALGGSVYVIEGGSIVQQGDPESIAASPATEFVAEFFDSSTGPAESRGATPTDSREGG